MLRWPAHLAPGALIATLSILAMSLVALIDSPVAQERQEAQLLADSQQTAAAVQR